MDFNYIINSKWLFPILYLLFALYISIGMNNIPLYFIELYDNSLFRLFIIGIITMLSFYDPKLAIIVSIAFFFILISIIEKRTMNKFV